MCRAGVPQRMVKLWRDAMRMGGGDLDSAPVLAAQIMVENRSFTELFTRPPATARLRRRDEHLHRRRLRQRRAGAGRRAHRPRGDAPVLREHGLPPRALGAGGLLLQQVPVRGRRHAGRDRRQGLHLALGPRLHRQRAHRLPGHRERGLRELPHQHQPPGPAVRELRRRRHVAGGRLGAHPHRPGGGAHRAVALAAARRDHAVAQGNPVADLAELGQAIAGDPGLGECMVARMWNWALSKRTSSPTWPPCRTGSSSPTWCSSTPRATSRRRCARSWSAKTS